MPFVKVRRDVRSLKDWDDVLVWYARAVKRMQKRPLSDPTSWRFQAAVHGLDPLGQKPGVWDQCQHQSWYFLPWHRGYLHWFEEIVRSAIVELKGPSDWALPYWNYSDSQRADASVLPAAFRAKKMPEGTANPLFVASREPHVNAGQPVGPTADVNADALNEPRFVADPPGGSGGFGGPRTKFHHGGGRFGELEGTPHGAVHVDIGGLMGDPATAALDPIFWLHHANIDRLWEIWRRLPGHADPTSSDWLNLPFKLHDAHGKVVTFRARGMLVTTSALLSYRYDSLTDPRSQPAPALAGDLAEPLPEHEPIVEMVGATTGSVQLGAAPTSTVLETREPTRSPQQGLAAGEASPASVFLNIANVSGIAASTNYDVYVNLPENASPQLDRDRYEEHRAGVLTTFGIDRASSPEDEHGGSGLEMSFNITDLVRRQAAEGIWEPSALRVTFVPRRADTNLPPVTVGQVSLHYAQ